MATYKFWSYLIFGSIMSYIFGYSLQSYLCFVVLMFVLYTFFKALWKDEIPVRHNYPTQGFGNISFNDSF